MSYYTYMYKQGDQCLYIGKANASRTKNELHNRINAHASEERFQPYLDNCSIYYCEWKNESDMNFMEKALIRSYKPLLNIADNQGPRIQITIDNEWLPYNRKRVHTSGPHHQHIACIKEKIPEDKKMFLKCVVESIKDYLYDSKETYVRVSTYYEANDMNNSHTWTWEKSTHEDIGGRRHLEGITAYELMKKFECPSCGKDTKCLCLECVKEEILPRYCYNCGHKFIRRQSE